MNVLYPTKCFLTHLFIYLYRIYVKWTYNHSQLIGQFIKILPVCDAVRTSQVSEMFFFLAFIYN